MVRGPRPPRASQRVATLTAERALAAKSNSPRFPCPRTRINDSRLFLRRGCYLTTRAHDRPHCSNGRDFTVISRDILRPANWKCLRRPGERGYSVLDNHPAPPAICTMCWRFTGANLNNPVAVRSQARPTSSEQILVVVMDASPGFFRGRRGLFILWRGLFILWPVLFILKGLAVQDQSGSVLMNLSHLELLHGVGRGGHRHDDTPVIAGVMDVNILQMVHEFHQHSGHPGAPLVSSVPGCSWRQ